MCGSTDMLKQDGVFVCQNCGTKYSVEEAKKLMIEGPVEVHGAVKVQGTVEVQGTVKVDESDELNKLYQLARRAKEEKNNVNAAKYYNEIVMKDPNSWEATFYASYFQACEYNLNDIVDKLSKLSNCSENVFKLIKEYVTDSEEQRKAVYQVATSIINLSQSASNLALNTYHGYSSYPEGRLGFLPRTLVRWEMPRNVVLLAGDHIVKTFEFTYGDIAAKCWRTGIQIEDTLINSFAKKLTIKERIEFEKQNISLAKGSYSTKIHKYDRDATLRSAKNAMDKGLYADALVTLKHIKGWEPADELIPICEKEHQKALQKFQEELEKKQKEEAEKKAEKAKKAKKTALIVVPSVCAVIILALLLIFVIIPSSRYNKAIELLDAGNTDKAYKIFNELGDYKGSHSQAGDIRVEKTKESLQNITVGSTIKFGAYEQDGNPFNGKEEIEWIVLKVEEGNKALLLSKYVLDTQLYHDQDEDITWENCSLRAWLNEDFLHAAFGGSEIQLLLREEVQPHINKKYPRVERGNPTYDSVFLLSWSELDAYLREETSDFREASATSYSKFFGAWLLRTPGYREDHVAYVNSDGLVEEIGTGVNDDFYNGIRPAIWINLSEVQ